MLSGMKNIKACTDCIHKQVCEYRSMLSDLQNELYESLKHTHFTSIERNNWNPILKLDDLSFIKTVKIECEHYERDTSILVG